MPTIQAIDIIIPVYKNAALTKICIDSILNNMQEIAKFSPRIVIINDSPDDEEVNRLLKVYADKSHDVLLLANEKNSGFVKSVNRGLEIAIKEKRNVILINSDTQTFKGTLSNLIDAANSDPQIGFISPRSNNASICTLPHESYSATILTPDETYDQWEEVKSTLPKVHFTPTAIGFYLFIKHAVIANFGLLSEEFGVGYEEENDLIMRANKAGYRAALANHAFAYHAGSASFTLLELDLHNHRNSNLQKMIEMHPEFLPLVSRYESSPHFRAEKLMTGLVGHNSDNLKIVIDLSSLGCDHNGTNELSINIIKSISRAKNHIHDLNVLCSQEAFVFHELNKLQNVNRIDASDSNRYAIAIRLGQPFDQHHINVLENLAPINVYGMLDTIAEDSGYLSVTHNLSNHWQHVARYANGIFCISQFSEKTFCNRYPEAVALPKYTKLLPTKLSSYVNVTSKQNTLKIQHVLILGNHFAHKASDATAKILAKSFPSIKFVVLGASSFVKANLQGYRSGTLSPETVEMLFARASVVVLPSHVEGFGFGFMRALAARKPIVARNIDATAEIIATFSNMSGVFLYDNDLEIQSALLEAMAASQSFVDDSKAIGWDDWAEGFIQFLKSLPNQPDVFPRLVNRIDASDKLRAALQADVLRSQIQTISNQSSENLDVIPKTSIVFDLDTLLKLEDRAFVESAYQSILKRLPDTDGLNSHLTQLRNGTPKIDILLGLQNSLEGQATGKVLDGLNLAASRSKYPSLSKKVRSFFKLRN